jgi:hypothetical protein
VEIIASTGRLVGGAWLKSHSGSDIITDSFRCFPQFLKRISEIVIRIFKDRFLSNPFRVITH